MITGMKPLSQKLAIRSEQGAFYCPPPLKDALRYQLARDASFLLPPTSRKSFVPELNPKSLSPIALLLRPCGPIAVVRLVVPVVVSTLKGVLVGRTRPHVRIEGFKRPAPLGADSNPATAVISKLFCGRDVLTLSHVHPRFVFGATVHPVNFSRHALSPEKNVLARFGQLLTQLSEPLLFYHDSPITEAKGAQT